MTRTARTRVPHPRRWVQRGLADRSATTAKPTPRRTAPSRAFIAMVVVVTVATTLGLVASGAPARFTDSYQKVSRATGAENPPAAPAREAPRPMAAAPLTSPAAGPSEGGQPTGDFVGWAILDQRTGAVVGSETMAETSTTASMIKAWIVADYLRLTAAAGQRPNPQRLAELSMIIRDSHNEHAQALFQEIGARASIERLISICQLTDSRPVANFWSNTQLSARDTARMGACLADGRAAGPQWTDWLLDEMRAVRGMGDFGIRHAVPPGQRSTIAIKNGWVVRDDEHSWHVNCLAIGDGWIMGVLTRYPAELGYEHGAELCRSLAEENLP